MTDYDINKIWLEFENAKLQDKDKVDPVNLNNSCDLCTNCDGSNVYNDNGEITCNDCGLVLNENRISEQPNFDNTLSNLNESTTYKPKAYGNKILKMQEWYMWTNEEKNVYKLKNYIRTLCGKLNIVESLVSSIIETVVVVMDSIKKNDGTKRARVKDGIVVICIYYVSKDTQTMYSYIDLAKSLNLDIKYVTKAERMILELINSKRLKLDKMTVLKTQKPFDYVINTIKKNDLKIPTKTLNDVQILINICEDNDLLLDHTPLSIGVCCFYYILKTQHLDIDLKMFSELYDLSVVTVVKTYNKLKVYDDKIYKLLTIT